MKKMKTVLALLLCLCMTLGLCGTAFAAEPALAVPDTPDPGMFFVHASVPASWKNPGAWAWSGDRNVFDAWPGEAMEPDGDWYTIQIPDWADHFIVNANGGKVQTEDLDIQPGKEVWITVQADGSAKLSYDEPAAATAEAAPAAESTDKADATIIVYIVGSNLESRDASASIDIAEMAASGYDFENKNLIVIAGGAKRWHLTPELPEKSTCVLEIRDKDFYLIDSRPAVNMADPATLTMYLDFCYENYPAESYGLILWDHGGGPIVGYGSDEFFLNKSKSCTDLLTMSELVQALDDSPFGKNNKLSFIGFDACMMSTLEVAWLLRDYAEYLVASEEVEPGAGWDYSFLGALAAGPLSGHDVGSCAVEAYKDYYLSNSAYGIEATLSLSCLNLAYADQLAEEVEALFSKLSVDLEEGAYSALAMLRYSAAPFPAKYTGSDCDLVDLGDLAKVFYPYYPEETEAILNTIDTMNEASWLVSDRETGMTIYFPLEHREEYWNGKYTTDYIPFKDVYRDLGFAPEYIAFLDDFSEQWNNSSKGFRDIENLPVTQEPAEEQGALGYYIQLTEEQAADTLNGGYALMVSLGDNQEGEAGYLVTAFFYNAYVDENDRLQVPVLDYLPVLVNEDKDVVMPTFYQDPHTNAYHLFAMLSTMEDLDDEDCESVLVIIPMVPDESPYTFVPLENALLIDENNNVIPRSDFPITDYPYISFFNLIYVPTYDENGVLLPAYAWELRDESALTFNTYRTDSYFQMLHLPLSELSPSAEFIVQVFGSSTYGEPFASELIPYTFQTWSVIGNIGGTDWDTDFSMLELYWGVFTTDPMQLKAGEEFKIRLNGSWDLNYGADGDSFLYEDESGVKETCFNLARDGENIVVEEDGTYYIVYDSTQNVVFLIPA